MAMQMHAKRYANNGLLKGDIIAMTKRDYQIIYYMNNKILANGLSYVFAISSVLALVITGEIKIFLALLVGFVALLVVSLMYNTQIRNMGIELEE